MRSLALSLVPVLATLHILGCGGDDSTTASDAGPRGDSSPTTDGPDTGRGVPDLDSSVDGGAGPSACPPLPAFPDENCTGWRHTGVTLEPFTGDTTITDDGTVIDGADIEGCLTVRASNV